MDQHEALIERMVDQIAAGKRPPPDAAEVDRHALDLPATRDLTIGEAAAMFGIKPTTIRYYEDAGLLLVSRRDNRHRVFDRESLGDLLFVHGMRLSGMGVKQIARLRGLLRADTPEARAETSTLLREHAEAVRRQIARLQISLAITEHKHDHLIGDDHDDHPA